MLVCPVSRRTGRVETFGLSDPKITSSYLFEFCDTEMGKIYDGGKIRMRDWKRRQMGLVGSAVPMVRCHLHDPVLNLSFDGKIYESPGTWENLFSDVVNMDELMPSKLFGQAADQIVLGLARPAATQAVVRNPEPKQRPISLSNVYNAMLTMACGLYRLHYADGQTQELPIVYGKQVRDWFSNPGTQSLDDNTVVAWSVKPVRDADNKTLFRTSWDNPLPDVELKSIDFVSGMADPAPFLIAISVE